MSAGRSESRAAALRAVRTSLVGRERERADIISLVADRTVRLVTLTGPGGIGKTRLALRVMEEAGDSFGDGVAFVDLSTIRDSALVIPTISQALDLQEAAGTPVFDQVRRAIGLGHRLLVLDSFEHVVASGPVLSELLAACPNLKILVTSREALRLSGESEYPVPALSLPAPGQVMSPAEAAQSAAVALFVQRARAFRPDFGLTDDNAIVIAAICARLDGLPLAIELAAARVKVLAPRAILARLSQRLDLLIGGPRDAPARLQTMRDAIAWSHDLLTDDDRLLFLRLAVFVGGCTLDAAEAVAGGWGLGVRDHDQSFIPIPHPLTPSPAVFEGISSLVDKSLVRQELTGDGEQNQEPRYVMLETVREFALERLERSGDRDELRARHAAWCLTFVEDVERGFFGPDQVSWLDRLEADLDNLRAALSWAIGRREADLSQRLAAMSWSFWRVRGYFTEGRDWLERALALDPHAGTSTRAKALDAAGDLAWVQGHYAVATTQHREALAIARSAGDDTAIARALFGLGDVALRQRRLDDAATCFDEALALNRQRSDTIWTAACLISLGHLARMRGEDDIAVARFDEGLSLYRRVGYGWGAAWAMKSLGNARRDAGDLPTAAELYRESLEIGRRHRDTKGIAEALDGLASIGASAGQAELAMRLFGAADGLYQAIGAPYEHLAGRERVMLSTRTALGDDDATRALAAGRNLSRDAAISAAGDVALTSTTSGPAPQPVLAAIRPEMSGLTPREMDVLRLLSEGKSSQEIADELFISVRTATTHVGNLLGKIGVESRAAAVAYALRNKLI